MRTNTYSMHVRQNLLQYQTASGYEHLLTVSEYVDNTIYGKKSPGLLDTVNPDISEPTAIIKC